MKVTKAGKSWQVSRQWSAVSGQWPVVSGQWSVVRSTAFTMGSSGLDKREAHLS